MKSKKTCIINIFIMLLFVYSCSNKEKSLLNTIPVHDSMGEGKIELQSENISFKNPTIIPLETTDESLLGHCRIVSVNDEFTVLSDRNKIYFFESNSGKYISSISRQGKSGQEYHSISDAIVNFKNEEIHIWDGNGRKMLLYKFNGDHKKTVRNDSIGTLTALDGETFVAYNKPTQKFTYNYGLYDKELNYIKGVDRRTESENDMNKSPSLIKYLSCNRYNNKLYTYKNDTLFEINRNVFNPVLFVDKGDYSIPEEIESDITREDEASDYISIDFGRLAKNYLFYKYYYDNKLYQDIWDLSIQKLVFRNIASSLEDNVGMPISYDNNILYVWPQYMQNDTLYCTLESCEVSKLGLEDDNEGNPVILRVEIK